MTGTLQRIELMNDTPMRLNFFYLWSTYNKEWLQIKYFSAEQKLIFTCDVSGKVCEEIGSGEKELSYMAQHVSFDFYKS